MSTKRSILFLSNSELGQASVVLAVAREVAVQSDCNVHVASFAPLKSHVDTLNQLSSFKVNWHTIPGKSMKESLASDGLDFLPRHAPGVKGAVRAYQECLPYVLAPWTPDEYKPTLHSCKELTQKLDPEVVIVDPLFGQGADACMNLGRRYMFLSAGTFKDHVVQEQPYKGILWKYSVLGSGFQYPVSWSSIPANIYLALNVVYHSFLSERVTSLRTWRNHNNIPGDLTTIFSNFNPKVPYLVQSTPETDFPLTIPPNVHGCGPILPYFSVNENGLPEDLPPTILFNLGSHITYTETETIEVLSAFETLLSSHSTIHITWKYQSADPSASSNTLASLPSHISSRITQIPWLPQTPLTILTHPSTILSIHHGGSNSFHEALAAGVPQVICPRWLDTYEFATRAEWLGVGMIGNKSAAPGLIGKELAVAIESVIGDEWRERFAKRAKEVREGLKRDADGFGVLEGGRKRAARLVIEKAGLDK
ncbi:hypothetical protein NX059_006865 [Plenodomus lindquistii]|nr:hypothetical protein NX059_006865 [Plenodomus lindquistii]